MILIDAIDVFPIGVTYIFFVPYVGDIDVSSLTQPNIALVSVD